MVNTQELRQQIRQSRESFEQARQNIQGQQLQFSQQQLRQQSLIQRQNALLEFQKGKGESLSQLQKQEQQFMEEIKPLEQQIKQYEEGQARQSQYQTALKVYLGQQTTPQGFGNIPKEIREQAQKQAESIEKSGSWRAVVDSSGKTKELIPEFKAKELESLNKLVGQGSIQEIEQIPKEYRKYFDVESVQIPVSSQSPQVTGTIEKADTSFLGKAKNLFQTTATRLGVVSYPAVKKYEETESYLSSKVQTGLNKIGATPERRELFYKISGETSPISSLGVGGFMKTSQEKELSTGMTKGFIEEPIEKPLKGVVSFVVGYGIGKAAGAVSSLGTTGKIISKVGGIGLGTAYLGGKGVELYQAPTFQAKGEILGGGLSTEVIPASLGYEFSKIDKQILKNVLEQQKELLADTRAKTGGKTKAKSKQEVVYRRKFGEKSDIEIAEELLRKVETDFKKGKIDKTLKDINEKLTNENSREGFEKFLRELKDRNLIKGYVYNIQTGEFYINKPISKPKLIESRRPITEYGKIEPQTEELRPAYVSSRGSLEPLQETPKQDSRVKIIEEDLFFIKPKSDTLQKQVNYLGISSSLIPKQTAIQTSLLKTEQLQKSLLQTKTLQKELQKQELKTSLFFKQDSLTKQKTKQEQRLKSGLSLIPRTSLGTRQDYITRNTFRPSRIEPRPRPKEEIKPTIEGFYIPRDRKKKGFLETKGKSKDLFLGQIRRFGKWKPVGKPTTFQKALNKSIKEAEYSLGASIKVIGAKSKIPVSLSPSKRFRTSKRNPFVLVEKRKYRLSTPSEIGEIQKSKKIKFFK